MNYHFKMKVSVPFLSLWIFVTFALSGAAILSANNSETELLQYILTNYSADVRPVKNHKDPVVVRFGIMLKQIIELNVMDQILTINVWLRMYWKSEIISWDPEEFGGLKSINIDPKKMWLPDLTVYNSVRKTSSVGDLYKKITSQVVVRHTGETEWFSPAILTTECKVDVRYFPFDVQICPLEFGSWTYSGFKIDLQLKFPNVDTKEYSVSKEWHLHGSTAERKVTVHNCCPEPFPSVYFKLVIKRRSMFYVFNLIIPCGLITLLCLFSFILPPNSGERVSFVITVLLSLSVYMLMVTEKMPHSADTPLASKFFLCMMVQVALSLVATCFIIKFNSNNTPIPPSFALFINQWLARLLLMKRKNEKESDVSTNTKDTQNLFFKNKGYVKDDTDLIITRVHDQRKTENDKNLESTDNTKNATKTTSQEELSKLVKEVKVLADKLREGKEEERLQDEWIFASQVLDRFFIFTLACSITLACIIIFTEARDIEMLEI